MTYWKTLVIIAVMICTAFLTGFVRQSERVPPIKPFSEFPVQIGKWQGDRGELDQRIYNILGVEDYILVNFRNEKKNTVNLYVGYYQSQSQGDIIHSPKNCLPGGGWNILETSTLDIPLKTGSKIKVIKLLIEKGADKQVVLYWFQSRGRIIASEYMQKIWLVVDSILRHRTDGSFVRLICPVINGETTSVRSLKDFARELYPVLVEHIPS